jgi:hypothetical protein
MPAHLGVQNLRRYSNSSLSISPRAKRSWRMSRRGCGRVPWLKHHTRLLRELSAQPATCMAIPMSAVNCPALRRTQSPDAWLRHPVQGRTVGGSGCPKRICANSIDQCEGLGSRGPNLSRAKNVLVLCPLWVMSGHPAMSPSVRFAPDSRHSADELACPFCAKRRHLDLVGAAGVSPCKPLASGKPC